jgi:hypothetical protein
MYWKMNKLMALDSSYQQSSSYLQSPTIKLARRKAIPFTILQSNLQSKQLLQ